MNDKYKVHEESNVTSSLNSMGRFMEDSGQAGEFKSEANHGAGIPNLPNYRIAVADALTLEAAAAGCRTEEEAPRLTSLSINEEEEGTGSGNSANRQTGNATSACEEEQERAEIDPMALLPGIMARYAPNLATRRDLRPIVAAAAVVAGVSAAITKFTYVVTKDDKVHPNLYFMNIAASGEGKKGFHVPVKKVTRVLSELEAASKPEASRAAKELRSVEREIHLLQSTEGGGDRAKLDELKQRSIKCQASSFPRNLAFGEDATPQMTARSIVRPGQGGNGVIDSEEGSKFFCMIGGRTKSDVGYGTLLTTCFNDASYKLSRYDEGAITHEGAENPRLTITLSIQKALVARSIEAIPASIGAFQRFIFVISENHPNASEPASLFSKGGQVDPHEMAYTAFVSNLTRLGWAEAGKEVALEFEPAAQERLDSLNREFSKRAHKLSSEDPALAEYVRRWIEQVIKLVQVFHVAQRLGNQPDKINIAELQKPISLDTLEKAIKFHEILSRETLIFVEKWVREVKTGLAVLSVEKVKGAVFKALQKVDDDCEGVSSSEILKNLPKVTSGELWTLIDENPTQFRVFLGGVSGRSRLVRVISNVTDFASLFQEGGKDAA